MWQAQRTADGFTVTTDQAAVPKFAFLDVRACELHASPFRITCLSVGHTRMPAISDADTIISSLR
jgi:hypothetical protein